MAFNSHYSGRLQRAVAKVMSEAPEKFYEIFNSHDFYDIADPNNGLTPEQRAQVPQQNQRRFTQLSYVLADAIEHVLGGDDGLLSKYVQEIIDKLDARSSMNSGQLNVLGASLSALPPLTPVAGAMRAVESQIGAAMGTNPFNPDMIPPITLGMPGLPSGVANTFAPGFFQPNWTFLYDREIVKNPKFYLGDGGIRIGAGIPITGMKENYLRKIFALNSVDRGLNPIGDMVGGLDADDYQKILEVSRSSNFSEYITGNKRDYVVLSDTQMRNSFNRYVNASLWDPIKNPTDWVNNHWGALANNACPEAVKTAVCSYIWTQGLSIEPGKSDDVALVSYLVTMGVFYNIGYQYNVRLSNSGLDSSTIPITYNSDGYSDVSGVILSKAIANKYFALVADIISRTTNLSIDEKMGIQLRKRRIDEANQIYKHVGLPLIEYGIPVNELPFEHTINGLKSRNFDKITKMSFYRYKNTGVAGGEGQNGELIQPTNLLSTLTFGPNANREPVTDAILNYIRSLMDQVGIQSAVITSTTRSAVDQCRAMYNNLIRGVEIRYGPAGRAVTNTFYQNKHKSAAEAQAAMVVTAKAQPEYKVSRHCADYNEKVILDIGPNSIKPQHARGAFETLLRQAERDGSIVLKVLTPADNDPAIHIELNPNANFNVHPNKEPPDVRFQLSDPALTRESAWNSAFSIDFINKNKTRTDNII